MIGLNLIGNSFKYEIENIIMMFFPGEKISQTEKGDLMNITVKDDGVALTVEVCADKMYIKNCDKGGNDELKFCRMLFFIF